jgi:hypothetical protein
MRRCRHVAAQRFDGHPRARTAHPNPLARLQVGNVFASDRSATAEGVAKVRSRPYDEQVEDTERPRDLVVAAEGSLADTRRLAERCAALDIAVWIGGQECCSGGGCGPKAALLVAPADAIRVAELMRREWLDAVERESPGAAAVMAKLHEDAVEGELPCPACGHTGPTVRGACGDCGLQLE